MGLDKEGFLNTTFQPREEGVEVPALAPWFTDLAEGETPSWTVRGLTHQELARAKEAADRSKSVEAVAQALAGGRGEKVQAIKDVMGTGDDVPQDTAKRMEMLQMGSTDPEADLDLALLMAKAFPVEFQQITDTIVRLTGQGQEAVKKQQLSGGGET